ncbi:MAG: hypothetical protein M1823_002417 [Watsoniomyces obsoletus]|nr:MAG: hypothetical protein M1823_002417 [Watsoniomyces obsoletus]
MPRPSKPSSEGKLSCPGEHLTPDELSLRMDIELSTIRMLNLFSEQSSWVGCPDRWRRQIRRTMGVNLVQWASSDDLWSIRYHHRGGGGDVPVAACGPDPSDPVTFDLAHSVKMTPCSGRVGTRIHIEWLHGPARARAVRSAPDKESNEERSRWKVTKTRWTPAAPIEPPNGIRDVSYAQWCDEHWTGERSARQMVQDGQQRPSAVRRSLFASAEADCIEAGSMGARYFR